jgi:hypothetical protein
VLWKGARADPLAVGALPRRFSVGTARKRPLLLRITAPSSNARMICGAFVYTRLAASSLRFGWCFVAPAVGEPLAEAGARHLTAQRGLEPASGHASAGRHRPLQVGQLGLHVCLERGQRWRRVS